MVNLGKIHVGDVNTDIQITCQNTSTSDTNSAIDFSSDTGTYEIIVIDPDENETTNTASLLNSPGTDGIVHFLVASASLFDEAGIWGFKAKITFDDGGIFTTNTIYKEVLG
jgi:hypothetical protein